MKLKNLLRKYQMPLLIALTIVVVIALMFARIANPSAY